MEEVELQPGVICLGRDTSFTAGISRQWRVIRKLIQVHSEQGPKPGLAAG